MKHLEDAHMSYTMHLVFALTVALKLFLLSLTAAVHGLLPFTFISTTSNGIKKLNEEL
jgi:hypothetical protein